MTNKAQDWEKTLLTDEEMRKILSNTSGQIKSKIGWPNSVTYRDRVFTYAQLVRTAQHYEAEIERFEAELIQKDEYFEAFRKAMNKEFKAQAKYSGAYNGTGEWLMTPAQVKFVEEMATLKAKKQVEEIFREIDEHRQANAIHGIPIISEEWLQSFKQKYGAEK